MYGNHFKVEKTKDQNMNLKSQTVTYLFIFPTNPTSRSKLQPFKTSFGDDQAIFNKEFILIKSRILISTSTIFALF